MKKTCTLTVALCFLYLLSWSQERIPADLSDDGQPYVRILNPSIAYEHKLAEKITLFVQGGINLIGNNDNNSNRTWNPYIGASIRNFYSRKRVKKQLKNNSGNYIGLTTRYHFNSIGNSTRFRDIENDGSFLTAAVWGIQRNYQSGIHLGVELGPGFIVGKNRDIGAAAIVDFTLGFTIGGKKAKMPQEWIDSTYK